METDRYGRVKCGVRRTKYMYPGEAIKKYSRFELERDYIIPRGKYIIGIVIKETDGRRIYECYNTHEKKSYNVEEDKLIRIITSPACVRIY